MKILHIASFVGNVGDNMSHIGLRRVLDDMFKNYQIDILEIRKFYMNYAGADKHSFDNRFLEKINDYDLCIIGGGGFLDYWVDGSASGTTIDIQPDLIAKITTPVLICSVGCIPHRPVPEGNIEKFKRFLEQCFANPNVEIILRNDGSLDNVRRHLGKGFSNSLSQGLDNAFFIEGQFEYTLPFPSNYIAINLASDQLSMNSELRSPIDVEAYYNQMTGVLEYICVEKDIDVVFVPHIYSDLKAISRLLDLLDDFIIRTKVSVAPAIQFDHGARSIASIYEHAMLTIGMRFHANIIPVSLGRKAIGIAALDRVKHMYDSIGLDESYVLLNDNFGSELCSKISDSLAAENPPSSRLKALREAGIEVYVSAIESIGLGHALKLNSSK